jgi:hypothetical protein
VGKAFKVNQEEGQEDRRLSRGKASFRPTACVNFQQPKKDLDRENAPRKDHSVKLQALHG